MTALAATRGRTLPRSLTGRALNPNMTALLEQGDTTGTYASRSNAVQATAVACAGAGWTFAEWQQALLGGAGEIAQWPTLKKERGGRLKPRTPADTERRLNRCWTSAQTYVERHPAAADAATVRAEVAALRGLLDVDPTRWRGQAGVTDYIVLTHLYDVADRANQLVIGRACRTIALDCQMTPGTASNSLRRLTAAGWLRLETRSDGRHASTFRLLRPTAVSTPAHLAATLENLPHRHTRPHGGTVVAHDVFVPAGAGGLGRTKARLLDLLDDGAYGGLTARQLAALSGLHPRTIARHLPDLQAVGLATVGMRGGWARAAPVADLTRRQHVLDELAGRLATAGTLTRRRDRIAAERDAREEFHARRGWAVERGLRQPGQAELFQAA